MDRPSRPASHRRLGDFEILRELGRGGMGIVYEARQLSLNRKVALKVLSASLGLTSKAVIRFKREAEAAARLHHTNIVPIYATGEHEGTHYYAMELIEGPGLDQVIAGMACPNPERSGGPATAAEPDEAGDAHATHPWAADTLAYEPPPGGHGSAPSGSTSSSTITGGGGYFDRVAGIFADVADALDYAHAQGVIHRDIKPANLLLSADGRLHINDFGLARMLEQPGMTLSGEFVGSPTYMSPEQIAVGRIPLDHRTDIYSLGASLYELLTLHPPFAGQRRDQVLAQIIHKDPRRPRLVNRKIPVDLETICLKAMEKDPDKRYQAAGDMAKDLRAYVNRFAISARRVGLMGRGLRIARRHKALVAAITCAAVAIAVAAAVAYRAHRAEVRHAIEQRQAQERAVERELQEASRVALNGDYDRAEALVNHAAGVGGNSGMVHLLRGQIELQRGDNGAAANEFQEAVALLPQSQAARAGWAMALINLWQFDRGYKLLLQAEGMESRTSMDYLAMGLAKGLLDPVKGLALLDKAVELRAAPMVLLGRANLRVAYAVHTSDPHLVELALRDVAAARTILPENDSTVSMTAIQVYSSAALVDEVLGLQDERQAVLKLGEAELSRLDQRPQTRATSICRAMYLMQIGEADQALAQLEVLCRKYSGPSVRMPLAMDWFRRGDSAKAMATLGDAPDELLPRALMDADTGEAGVEEAKKIYAQLRIRENPLSRWYANYIPLILGQYEVARSDALALRNSAGIIPMWHQWANRVLDYRCGLLSDQELVDAAGNSIFYRSGAFLDIGLAHLAKGDRKEARIWLERCAAVPVRSGLEYGLSKAFLLRMDKDPLWPRWIPPRPLSADTRSPTPASELLKPRPAQVR